MSQPVTLPENSGQLDIQPNHSPKWVTFGFAIAIILLLGGLATGGTGIAGHFHVGLLSHMSQVNAIILMSVGGGSTLLAFIIGIVCAVKRCQGQHSPQVESQEITSTTSTIDPQGGTRYGPEAWPALAKKWSSKLELEIVDEIPEEPQVPVAKGKVRLYIPEKIKINGGEPEDFNLNTLVAMGASPIDPELSGKEVRDRLGHLTASGWIEIDRNVIPGSLDEKFADQKKMVGRGCRLPHLLEAVVLNLMVFAFTGDRLYGEEPDMIYTRCIEEFNGETPIVGGFGDKGLCIQSIRFHADDEVGIATVRKF